LKPKESAFIVAQALIVVAVLVLVALPLYSINQRGASSTLTASTAISSGSTSSTAYPPILGLQPLVGVNSTTLSVGQRLELSVDLRNTMNDQDNVPPLGAANFTSYGGWRFFGFPIAIWAPCAQALEFVVVKGNFTGPGLAQNMAGGPVMPFCPETTDVTSLVFQPNSDMVMMGQVYPLPCCALNGTSPTPSTVQEPTLTYRMESNFTVTGYWNTTAISNNENLSSTHVGTNGLTFGIPEVEPLGSTQFTPGVYTLAVCDEWGQLAVIQFTVQ